MPPEYFGISPPRKDESLAFSVTSEIHFPYLFLAPAVSKRRLTSAYESAIIFLFREYFEETSDISETKCTLISCCTSAMKWPYHICRALIESIEHFCLFTFQLLPNAHFYLLDFSHE